MIKALLLLMTLVPLSARCADSSLDDILIHRNARNVETRVLPESNVRQITYDVNLKYPLTAFTESTFAEFKKRGWSRCSGYPEGWDSYVDQSEGNGREHTIFQNNSYWSRGNALLTISMRYYAGIAKGARRLKVPDNTKQQIVVLENDNPEVKERLRIQCN